MKFWTINRIIAGFALMSCAMSSAFGVATFLYLLSAIATDQPALAWNVGTWFARFAIVAIASLCIALLLMIRQRPRRGVL